MNPIILIIIIVICIVAIVATMFFFKKEEKQKSKVSLEKKTANEFVNVKDIRDKFLYTLDGYVITYIKIHPISIDLFSYREKRQLSKTLTAELSSERKMFKFLAVSRPVDISPLINEYMDILSNTNEQKQKEILRHEMIVMSNYALSGEVVERQFYIMLWEKFQFGIEQELAKRAHEMVSKFENSNIRCEILKQQEIARLCNLINNPAYVYIEDQSFESTIPILNQD